MKRLAALIVIAAGASASTAPDDLAARLEAFHRHYNAFTRSFLGCPKNAAMVEDCDPKAGVIDYQEFFQARKAAEKLFDLQPVRKD